MSQENQMDSKLPEVEPRPAPKMNQVDPKGVDSKTFCRNCDAQVSPQAVICVSCGAPPMKGSNYCWNCGQPTNSLAEICLKCGVRLNRQSSAQTNIQSGEAVKSKMTAGLLSIFLGWVGVGRFYLGFTGIGILQIVSSIFTLGLAGSIWGVIEGILILTGTFNKDAKGRPLV